MRLRLAAVAVAIVAADQLTKWLVVRSVREGESISLIDGVLWLSHIRNPGAAFGTLRGWGTVLALAAVIGVVVFASIIIRNPPTIIGVGAALVAGGATGNLIDRVFRAWPLKGTVVDFIDFRFWPAFNVADTAVTVGAILLVGAGLFERSETGKDAGTRSADRDR
jgi:signal peptidase II